MDIKTHEEQLMEYYYEQYYLQEQAIAADSVNDLQYYFGLWVHKN